MTDERLLQEAIARCVSILVFYHNCERTRDSLARTKSEVRAVARQFPTLGIPPDEAERRVIDSVREEMMMRYGHEVGPRISAQFVDAFEGTLAGSQLAGVVPSGGVAGA